jgi:hypothetical protein
MNYDDECKKCSKLHDPREQDQHFQLERRRQAYINSLGEPNNI